MRTRRTLIAVILLETIFLVGLVVTLVALHRRPQRGTSPADTGTWFTASGRTKLLPRFAWTASMVHPPKQGQRFRLRLSGQTRMLELLGDHQGLTAWEAAASDSRWVVGKRPWPVPLKPGDSLQVSKTPDAATVFMNGQRLLYLPCPIETWHSAVWSMSGMDVPCASFTYQKVGSLLFHDDFMHDEGQLGEWVPSGGTWTIHALQNPIRSANPFSLLGKGENAAVMAGYWFWRNYEMTCAVHPLPGCAFGLLFCFTDPGNTYQLKWEPKTDKTPAGFRLLRIANGQTILLDEKLKKCPPSLWVQLGVRHLEGLLSVFVDDTMILQVVDPEPLFGGRVGLWTNGGEGTVFDDVAVRATDTVQLDLTEARGARPAFLQHPTAEPEPAGQSQIGGVSADAPLAGDIDIGGIVRENAAIAVDLKGVKRLRSHIELRCRQNAAGEYIGFRLSSDQSQWRAELFARWDGRDVWIDRTQLKTIPDTCRVSLHTLDTEAWCRIGDRLLCFGSGIPAVGKGICGVRVPTDEGVRVERIRVSPQLDLPAIENRVETFTHEESMQNWNSPVLEWVASYTKGGIIYWHGSDFWQDLAVSVDRQKLQENDLGPRWGLTLRGPESDPAGDQISLAVEQRGKDQTLQLTLAPEHTRTLDLMRPVLALAMEKRGDRLLVRLNGTLVWNEPLHPALRGLCQVGRFGSGAQDAWAKAIEIRAAGVRTYSFKTAPVDWLPAAGTWEVTNRWQCDPRWSFFSGKQRHGVACNWNKLRHGRNVSLEFFAGPKMDQDRGKRYEYAGDINAVIAADGRDINSGYSFLFGGSNDKGSYILRGDRILGKNLSAVIPRSSSIHRRWFHIKIRKHEQNLAMWIDGRKVVEASDPTPATGDRFALWTWDNGIMVSQARISTDSEWRTVPASEHAVKTPKTPYDIKLRDSWN